MAGTTRIPDRDAHIVQLPFYQKQCNIHVVRGEAKWRVCIKCGVSIMREDDDA